MKLLAGDYAQAFTNCTTILRKDMRVVRIRDFRYPKDATGNSDIPVEDVQYVVQDLSNGGLEVANYDDLLFLAPPKKYGWVNMEGRAYFISMNSRRQWRKGLTSRRLSMTRISPIHEEGGGIHYRRSDAPQDNISTALRQLFCEEGRASLGKVVGAGIRRAREGRSIILRLNNDIALHTVDKEGRTVVFYEDMAMAVYVPKQNTLCIPPENACYTEHLREHFEGVTITNTMEGLSNG